MLSVHPVKMGLGGGFRATEGLRTAERSVGARA